MVVFILCTIFVTSFKSENNTNIVKMNSILIKHGEAKMIGILLKVSQPTIRKALRGDDSTALLRNIRKMALTRGGVELNKD